MLWSFSERSTFYIISCISHWFLIFCRTYPWSRSITALWLLVSHIRNSQWLIWLLTIILSAFQFIIILILFSNNLFYSFWLFLCEYITLLFAKSHGKNRNLSRIIANRNFNTWFTQLLFLWDNHWLLLLLVNTKTR